MTNPLYKKEDFHPTTWNGAIQIMDELAKQIKEYAQEHKLQFDAVMPLARGGNIPGTYFTYQLEVLRVLPIQYHYFFGDEAIELRQLYGPEQYTDLLSDSPTILLVEDNHCFGRTAAQAAKDIRQTFKNPTIIYVAFQMDYSSQDVVPADKQFYGRLTNECRTLNADQAEKLGVMPDSYLLPWEHIEEEWTTIEGKQVQYQDIAEAEQTFKTKQVIDEDH